MPARPIHLLFRRPTRGMSLIEVMIALGILAITLAGVLAALVQSRRLTEGSLAQNSALTIVQGYMEQIKNMEISQVANFDANGNAQLGSSFSLPTLIDQNTPDPLQTSVGTPPALGSFVSGKTPSGLGIIDNLKDYDLVKDSTALTMNATDNSTTATTTQVAWNTIWPNALNFPLTTGGAVATAGKSDLHVNIWVWITDMTSASAKATKVYGVTLIYTWQFLDGGKTSYAVGTVRSIRSSVPTF